MSEYSDGVTRMRTKAAEVARAVDVAFSGSRMPSSGELVYEGTSEARAIKAWLQGRDWHSLNGEEIFRKTDVALISLTGAGYRYLVPAWLQAALHGYPQVAFAATLGGEVVQSLAPNPYNGYRLAELAQALNAAQCEVLLAFVEWNEQAYEAVGPFLQELHGAREFLTRVLREKRAGSV